MCRKYFKVIGFSCFHQLMRAIVRVGEQFDLPFIEHIFLLGYLTIGKCFIDLITGVDNCLYVLLLHIL